MSALRVSVIANILVQILASPVSGSLVSQQNELMLAPECFDTLPYGVERTCTARFLKKTKGSLGDLYSAIIARIAADSLLITARDSADTGVAVVLAPQTPRGCCSRGSEGPGWDSPRIAVHFDATPRDKKEAGFLLIVQGSVVAREGRAAGAMALAICYIVRYFAGLNAVPPRDQKRGSP